MRIRTLLFGLFLGSAASCVYAQTAPSPADVGIVKSAPNVFKLLDSSKTWTPFGSIDPSTHIFLPGTNGPIAPDDCVKWGPGLTDAGAVCNSVTGGAHPANQLTIYTAHSGLVANVTTPTEPWTVVQQGFYAPGDNGAAVYQWNPASYCATGTSGSPAPADGFICVLPIGQSASTAGRYLLQLNNKSLDVTALGFRDDGSDNAPLVATLNTILNLYPGMPIHFPVDPGFRTANYWFSQPLEIVNTTTVTCGDGQRQMQFPPVNLAFGPGVSGVRFDGYGMPGLAGVGAGMSSLAGCGIISTGYAGVFSSSSIAGNTTVQNQRITTPSALTNGAVTPEPVPSIGDSVALFNPPSYWYPSGSITGNVLTVTSWGGGTSATDPGIAPGQMVQGNGVPFGTFIRSTHAEDPAYTGTGQTGTYEIYPSIATPVEPTQANPGTLTGGFQLEVQTGPPLVPPGTIVTGCSTLTGTQCPTTGGATMTLSNAPRLGLTYAEYLLPGPDTASPYGSQMYNITTSLTGQNYGPFTGSYDNGSGGAGYQLTITGGPGGLNLGQTVLWGPGGTPVTTTTTAAIKVGDGMTFTTIPVASCAGIDGNKYVVATSGGHPVFAPYTRVSSCSGTTLTLYQPDDESEASAAYPVNGSNKLGFFSYYYAPYSMWIGEPIQGTNIPANTVLTASATAPCCPGLFTVPMSNAATGAPGPGGQSVYLGGAIYAAPSGTTLTFLDGAATIASFISGSGGNGTYGMADPVLLPPGSILYAYDTPATIYVTGGPRIIQPQDLIWSDAFPFGTVAAKIYGNTPSKQTVITAITGTYGVVSAHTAHTAGSGKLWTLPNGIGRNTAGNSYGNFVEAFAVGLNMACAAGNNFPGTGCGRSNDSNNFYQHNLVGRLTAGNNSGGGASEYNEYDHNFVADIAELGTVGSTYIGEMLQGEDETSNSHVLTSGCLTNASSFTGIYASGAQWSLACYPGKDQMISDQTGYLNQFLWYGAIYGAMADSVIADGAPSATVVNCSGAPTGSFAVYNGRVTHC